jgi:hypothetical protein
MELAFLPAVEQARLVRSRQVSSAELVHTYLERIERIDPALNAYVTVLPEEAIAAAEAIDAASGDEPFRGVPIAVKDLTATAGIRTTYSSHAYAHFVPDYDTAVVRRLRDAGFVLLGKTNTPEFGTTAFTESELDAHAGRVERRRGCRPRRRAHAGRARNGRRGIDPHSRLVLRRLRAQAVARPRLGSAVHVSRGTLDRRTDLPDRPGRRRAARRPRGIRAG